MATLGTMKSRIATELARSDLTTDIATAIMDAVDEFSDVPFYFLTEEVEADTTAGVPTLALPTGFRRLQMVTVTVGTQRYDMPPDRDQITYEEYRARNWDTTRLGQPRNFAIFEQNYYFDPTPDQAYTITSSFVYKRDVPASDGSSNAWTTDAEAMIRAKAKALLYRDRIRNLEQASVQEAVAQSWRVRLLSRSAAQMARGICVPATF